MSSCTSRVPLDKSQNTLIKLRNIVGDACVDSDGISDLASLPFDRLYYSVLNFVQLVCQNSESVLSCQSLDEIRCRFGRATAMKLAQLSPWFPP